MLDYDRGPHNADDSLGVAELELDHIIPNKMEYRWLRIKHPEDEGRHPPLGQDELDDPKYAGIMMVQVEYIVDPKSEALSVLWLEEKKAKVLDTFSLGKFKGNADKFQKELKPYMDAADEMERLMYWKNFFRSAVAFFFFFFTAWNIENVMVVFHCVIGGTLIWNKLCPRSPIFFPPPDESAVVSKGPVKEKKFPYLIESAAKAVLGGMAKHQMKLEEYHAKLIKVKDIFMWKKSFISAAATGGNFFAACVHLYLPLKYFMCFGVTGGFLVESELGRWTGRLSRAKALYTQRMARLKEYKQSGKEVDATAKKMAHIFATIAQDKRGKTKTQYTMLHDHEMISNTFANIDDSGDNEIDTEELEQALTKLNDGDEKYPARHLMTIFDKEGDGRCRCPSLSCWCTSLARRRVSPRARSSISSPTLVKGPRAYSYTSFHRARWRQCRW
mmetsp:Transcript_85062/g.241091  ORF Transcript_85062/g.241091 Transcript_85062/m.241091 type:complete len:444 (+) Transcript_85062:190-1521(+)